MSHNHITFLIPEIHKKGWGQEIWIKNIQDYCAKILEFNAGGECSMHFHGLKVETWYVAEGQFTMKYYDTDMGKELEKVLNKGDIVHVPRFNPHQLKAIVNSKIWEVSSTHYEEDSYRVKPGNSQKTLG